MAPAQCQAAEHKQPEIAVIPLEYRGHLAYFALEAQMKL